MTTIHSINATAGEGGAYTFTVELAIEGRLMRLPIGTAELLSYHSFQSTALSATGRMYLYPSSEGRPPELADYFWRNLVCAYLDSPDIAKKPEGNPRTPSNVN